MPRRYIRPEVPQSLYQEMLAGRHIMINPTEADLLASLEAVQSRSRERLLSEQTMLSAWRRFSTTAMPGIGLVTATSAPDYFRWPMHATLFQAVVITDDLIGVIFHRIEIAPGTQVRWPVPGATGDTAIDSTWEGSAIDQRNAIVTAFWLHLSDADIQALDAYTAAASTAPQRYGLGRISMDLELSARNAVVLGGSRGLGRAIATTLAAEGANVLICSRSADALEATAAELNQLGSGQVSWYAADLADPQAPASIHAEACRVLGHVDILINNGGGPPPGPITAVERATWEAQYQAMVVPLLELTGLCLPAMRERQWGRILTVVSSGVLQPIPNLGISNTLRSSIIGWSKTLASEVAADGITVNCLAPGRIATDRVASLDQGAAERQGITAEEAKAQACATIPMGRYGDPREFGDIAGFLASPRGSYITGSVIRVDGGLVLGI